MTVDVSALRSSLERDGFAVVPAVVPPPLLDAVIADMWRHTGADPNDRESWYKPGIVAPTGMVEMYQYQLMWNTRQHPQVHQVFSDIFGSQKLWVSLDRVNLKPPADPRHPEHDHKGFIHWDTDTSRYPTIPFRVQGVLALADTEESQGGFQCVPGLYRELGAWIARQPADRPPRRPDLAGYTIEQIPLKAGDLVIWSTLMPHGNGHNVSDRPRLAQYISMSPAGDDETARQNRIRSWQECTSPQGTAFPGDPRRIEEQAGVRAHLTPLGRKLLGIDRWE